MAGREVARPEAGASAGLAAEAGADGKQPFARKNANTRCCLSFDQSDFRSFRPGIFVASAERVKNASSWFEWVNVRFAGRCALVTLAACEQSSPTTWEEVRDQSPELQAMFDAAAEQPAVPVSGGFLVRSTPLAAATETIEGQSWLRAPHEVRVELGAASVFSVTTGRHVSVKGHRLGTAGAGTRLEDGAVIVEDDTGNALSVLMSRPGAVEELLVQRHADLMQGYELDLPVGWSLARPNGFPGLVEILDSRGRPRVRLVARTAWDSSGQRLAVQVRLDGRRVLFEVPGATEYPVVIDPEWQDTSSPINVRARATATLLQTGELLVIGGLIGTDDAINGSAEVTCSTELFDPYDLVWRAGPPLRAAGDADCTPVMDHVAVPLADGTVLITGGANKAAKVGANQPAAISDAWTYNPSTRSFERRSSMVEARVHHTGTLIPATGQVLIAGGTDRMAPFQEKGVACPTDGTEPCQRCVGKSSAELYDPATGTFSIVPMPVPRACHTATLLDDSSVLLVGGGGEAMQVGASVTGRARGELSLFKSGGFAELPTTLNSPRFGHVAVLRPDTNQLLVALGRDEVDYVYPPKLGATVAELIDVGDLLSAAPSEKPEVVACDAGDGPPTGEPLCPAKRTNPAGILMRSGSALIVGGQTADLLGTLASDAVDEFRFEGGATEGFLGPKPPQLISPASKPVLTEMPTGKVALVGLTAPAELIENSEWAVEEASSSTLSVPRARHTATRLADGKVLITGGVTTDSTTALDTAEIYDPQTGQSTVLSATMSIPREDHSAVYLPANDQHPARVLLIGGGQSFGDFTVETTSTMEIFDTSTQTFSPVSSMGVERIYPVGVRLPSGKVLITGDAGDDNVVGPPTADLYDPETDTVSALPPPSVGRMFATATLLASGDVLIAGGYSAFNVIGVGELSSAELFDPQTLTFSSLPSMVVPRAAHTATVLADGRVLIAGGTAASTSAELFDPETGTFAVTAGAMAVPRLSHDAVVVPSGKVVISGGAPTQLADSISEIELFDPATEQFELLAAPAQPQVRADHPSLLLADGRVALIGGTLDKGNAQTTADITLIAQGLGTDEAMPSLYNGPFQALPGASYEVSGSALSNPLAVSSGPYASASGSPIAVWVPSTGAPSRGVFAPWSDTGAVWSVPSSPFAGDGVLFATVQGQASVPGLSVEIELAPNGVACTADAACSSGFCSDGVCCNERCHVAGDPDSLCRACSVEMGAGEDGVCSVSAEGQDPHEDCASTPQCSARFAVCGAQGSCQACFCTSNLDCADGYVCTADGTCEPRETIIVGGCSAAPSPPQKDWLIAAFAGLLCLGARRRRTHITGEHR